MTHGIRRVSTLVEFGTDKICVAYGSVDEAGKPMVLAYAEASSQGSVCKGEIRDFATAGKIFLNVLKNADLNLPAGTQRGNVYYIVNGAAVHSCHGKGRVQLSATERKITQQHVESAVDRAVMLAMPPDEFLIDKFEEYFLLDGQKRVMNPLDEPASTLDACLNIVTADQKYIQRLEDLFKSAGFDQECIPVYSVIAPYYSVLSSDEINQGTLLVDFGAGTCAYSVIAYDGLLLSGIIPVGTCHIANDLHVGLDLPFDWCMDFLAKNKLTARRDMNAEYVEYSNTAGGKSRRIPLNSFESIIIARVQETLSLVADRVKKENLTRMIRTGCVLTGGGALLDVIPEQLRNVTGMQVRIGEPEKIPGMPDSKEGMTRYASLLGMLKFAATNDNYDVSGVDLTSLLVNVFNTFRNSTKVWKKL